MIAPDKLKNAICAAIARTKANLKVFIDKLKRPVKKTDPHIGNIYEHEAGTHADFIYSGNIISQEKAFNHFPLSADMKFDIGTGRLPVPIGMIKFSDMCTKMINPEINHE